MPVSMQILYGDDVSEWERKCVFAHVREDEWSAGLSEQRVVLVRTRSHDALAGSVRFVNWQW